MNLLVQFLTFAGQAVPALIPQLFKLAGTFWGNNDLGPLPPCIACWETADAKIDQALKENKS